MTAATPSDPQLLRRVADELEIRQLVARLARAQDDRDRDTYRGCFTDRVLLTEAAMTSGWEPREISVDELADMYFTSTEHVEFGHHMVFNLLISTDGDRATCGADLFAVASRQAGGDSVISMTGGRYDLGLRRSAGRWLICERAMRVRYRI